MWKFLGRGLNLCHHSHPSCCSGNSGSLTCCTARELPLLVLGEGRFPAEPKINSQRSLFVPGIPPAVVFRSPPSRWPGRDFLLLEYLKPNTRHRLHFALKYSIPSKEERERKHLWQKVAFVSLASSSLPPLGPACTFPQTSECQRAEKHLPLFPQPGPASQGQSQFPGDLSRGPGSVLAASLLIAGCSSCGNSRGRRPG